MTAVLLAVLLAADGGTTDGGFIPLVLDVNHAALWLNEADGGVSDAPRLVRGGAWLDDPTLMHVSERKAFGTAALAVPPDIDAQTATIIGAVMFAVGVAVGAAVVGGLALAKKF